MEGVAQVFNMILALMKQRLKKTIFFNTKTKEGIFTTSSVWCSKEFIVLSNIGIHRFEDGKFDHPKSTIPFSHDLKIIDCPTLQIDMRGGLI